MDIITHAISGIAVGSFIAGIQQQKAVNKAGILGISAFGAILPDIDAISLWSKFDSTIGNIFQLEHTGKDIYTSKFWYSHHGFMHSVTVSLLIVFVIYTFFYFILKNKKSSTFSEFISKNRMLGMAFCLGFFVHLIEDMPTPQGAWGGVNLFWPSKAYFGGYGKIWWWNNYDIFLIACTISVLNIFLIFSKLKRKIVVILSLLFLISGFSVGCYNIQHRNFNFNEVTKQKNYAYLDQKSLEIQHQMLGDKIFYIMNRFDNSIKLNF